MFLIIEKVDLKNELAYLAAKRRAVLQNIIASTKEHESRTEANKAITEAQNVFKENQLLHRQLMQAKLKKIQSGATSTPHASSSPNVSSSPNASSSPNRGFIPPHANASSAHGNSAIGDHLVASPTHNSPSSVVSVGS